MAEEREQKNQVFSGAPAPPVAQPGIAVQSAAERVKIDFGVEIPVETVPLPSDGKLYPRDSSLYMRETLDIRGMSAREEDILTSAALLKKGTVISELIRSCLIDKTIDPASLVTGDRNTLMVAIRITGYGHEYDTEITCPECEVKAQHQFNLAQLPIQRLDIEPVEQGTNVFSFELPGSKLNVCFRFLTGKDEEEIVATTERQKKQNMRTDAAVTTGLLYSIVSVSGERDRNKIAGFVRNGMAAKDSSALRKYIRDHEPGIRMKQETTCPSCGHSEEVTVPLGASFLWPNSGQ